MFNEPNLHIVLEDFNVKDSHLQYCRGEGLSKDGEDFVEVMLGLSEAERVSALALAEEFFTDPDAGTGLTEEQPNSQDSVLNCNHVIGFATGVDESWLVTAEDQQWEQGSEIFSFCPRCGSELVVTGVPENAGIAKK
jgi:hypothetical protein